MTNNLRDIELALRRVHAKREKEFSDRHRHLINTDSQTLLIELAEEIASINVSLYDQLSGMQKERA